MPDSSLANRLANSSPAHPHGPFVSTPRCSLCEACRHGGRSASHDPVCLVRRWVVPELLRPSAYITRQGTGAAGFLTVAALGLAGAIPGLWLGGSTASGVGFFRRAGRCAQRRRCVAAAATLTFANRRAPDPLPRSLAPRGLSRVQGATYVGVGPSLPRAKTSSRGSSRRRGST